MTPVYTPGELLAWESHLRKLAAEGRLVNYLTRIALQEGVMLLPEAQAQVLELGFRVLDES